MKGEAKTQGGVYKTVGKDGKKQKTERRRAENGTRDLKNRRKKSK